MKTTVIRAFPSEDAAGELESEAQVLFAALHDQQPAGLAWYSLREDDGSYLIVLQLQDGAANPLLSFPGVPFVSGGVGVVAGGAVTSGACASRRGIRHIGWVSQLLRHERHGFHRACDLKRGASAVADAAGVRWRPQGRVRGSRAR